AGRGACRAGAWRASLVPVRRANRAMGHAAVGVGVAARSDAARHLGTEEGSGAWEGRSLAREAGGLQPRFRAVAVHARGRGAAGRAPRRHPRSPARGCADRALDLLSPRLSAVLDPSALREITMLAIRIAASSLLVATAALAAPMNPVLFQDLKWRLVG